MEDRREGTQKVSEGANSVLNEKCRSVVYSFGAHEYYQADDDADNEHDKRVISVFEVVYPKYNHVHVEHVGEELRGVQ